ncbi:ubiquitin-conjugating enzyme E2 R2 isoform X1 [Myotis yumanensis]|uniref:ubiquitin-conjugating enzyme E2 R2 isoform X1 n=1 Tax=Myotis yumanensis TaxID=159337 RepID=UPI0038D3C842
MGFGRVQFQLCIPVGGSGEWGGKQGSLLFSLAFIHLKELGFSPPLSSFSLYFCGVSKCPLSSPCPQLSGLLLLLFCSCVQTYSQRVDLNVGRLSVPHFRETKLEPFAQVANSLAKGWSHGLQVSSQAHIKFPIDYPYSPPTFRFLTKMWHPNIYENGDVCISILHPPVDDPQSGELPSERWNPTQNVRTILLSVISLLNEPNTFSPANVDASVMFRKWRDSKGKDKEYAEIIRKQVSATKAEAEKDGVKVPTTLAEYCIKTKVPSNDNSSDLLYDDLYDDDIDDEDEEEEDADCYDDDDSGNEES